MWSPPPPPTVQPAAWKVTGTNLSAINTQRPMLNMMSTDCERGPGIVDTPIHACPFLSPQLWTMGQTLPPTQRGAEGCPDSRAPSIRLLVLAGRPQCTQLSLLLDPQGAAFNLTKI